MMDGTSIAPMMVVLHVAMGGAWALASLAVVVTGRVWRGWPLLLLGAAGLNLLAGIYLWHALHAGAWGRAEHLLATGTFCAFIALGIQGAILFGASSAGRLERPARSACGVTLIFIAAAATAMILSKIA